MPHLISHLKPSALETFEAAGLMLDKFNEEVEAIVADIFNTKFNETLVAGETVKTDGIFISETMPTEIHITVLAWYTHGRRGLQTDPAELGDLNKKIERAIADMTLVKGVPIEDVPWVRAHVVVVTR